MQSLRVLILQCLDRGLQIARQTGLGRDVVGGVADHGDAAAVEPTTPGEPVDVGLGAVERLGVGVVALDRGDETGQDRRLRCGVDPALGRARVELV